MQLMDVLLVILCVAAVALVIILKVSESIEKNAAAQRKEQKKLHEAEIRERDREARDLLRDLKRQQDAAEQAAAQQAIILANAQREMKKQTLLAVAPQEAKDLEVVVNRRLLTQARQGRVLNAHFVAVLAGRLVIQWTVDCDGPSVPLVTGFRDGRKIFAEHSFAGEHPDQIKRGQRYVYSFRVQRDGQVIEKEDEFLFEVVIPTPGQWNRATTLSSPEPPEDPDKRRVRLIEEKGKAVTEQMSTLNATLAAAEERMRREGLAEDAIQFALARLEAELSEALDD